jgi:hypothetical protein
MTRQKKYPLTELSTAVAPARERHRELIDAAVAWQAGRGRPTDPDHFALICAAADDEHRYDAVTPTRWTRTGVYGTVRCGIPNWSSAQRTLWPETICEAMWTWFDFLHATGRLEPGSDPVAELRKPLACYGWLDQHGCRMPAGAERQIECECFLPYRETVELLGEIVRSCEWSGEDPLDVLRRAAGRDPSPRWRPFGDDGADLFGDLDGYGSVGLIDDPGPYD